jgi:hypothetical protein
MRVNRQRAKILVSPEGRYRLTVAVLYRAAATALASRDLRRAAVRLWIMPLAAALSSERLASRARARAVSPSPSSAAARAFLASVFSAERTALLRTRATSF